MSTAKPSNVDIQAPRSILKKAKLSADPDNLEEVRNRETALRHAHLLQHRKDTEFLILSSTESLLDLPLSPNADPARPSSQDATIVKNLLTPFQPSDYDALIQERNINRQCGYVLCPRSNKLQDTCAKYRIVHTKGQRPDALQFVRKGELEKWCSDDCGRRALFIKAQLHEEPAWSRIQGKLGDIVLLEHDSKEQVQMDNLVNDVQNLSIEEREEEIMKRMKVLALERGDHNPPSKSFGMEDVVVQHKHHDREGSAPSPPSISHDPMTAASLIEGFRPRPLKKDGTPSSQDRAHMEDLTSTI